MSSKNGKMIAVWGSRDAGKTTVSVKLALNLAKQQKESLVVLTDVNAPDMKCILPVSKELKSMGNVWVMPDVDEATIYNSCVVTPSEYICVMGYTPGENAFSYSDSTKENVFKVYEEMRSIVDYVIVDCVPNLAYNMLTAVALETADNVVRIGEATTKSFSFFDSNVPLIVDNRYEKENHIRVLAKTKTTQPVEIASNRIGNDIELPYSEEVALQMMEGKLFTTCSDSVYNAGIDKIVSLLEKEEMEGLIDYERGKC